MNLITFTYAISKILRVSIEGQMHKCRRLTNKEA